MKKKSLPFWAFLLFSLLFWAVFIHGVYFLVWIVFVPVFFVLLKYRSRKSVLFFSIYSVGITLLTFYWVASYHSVALLGISLLCIISLLGYFGVLHYFFKNYKKRAFAMLFPALLWILLLFIHSFLPLGNFAFTFALFQPQLPLLLQSLSSFGVTFLIFLSNSFVAFFFATRKRKYLLFEVVLLLIVTISFVHSFIIEESDKKITVALIQGNVDYSWSYRLENPNATIDLYEVLSYGVLKSNPDIIIWPEYALAVDLSTDEVYSDRLSQLSDDLNVTLVVGSLRWTDGFTEHGQNRFDTAFVYSDGLEKGFYDSMYPLPFEFPVQSGNGQVYFDQDGLTFSTVLCFEETQRKAFADISNTVDFVVSLSNNQHFKEYPMALKIVSQFSKLYAAEFGVPVIRTTNNGITQVVDRSGRVFSTIESGEMDVLVWEISI